MRPPTEAERLAVFLAAMAVTRLLLPRTKPDALDLLIAYDRAQAEAEYRARYGANNAREN